jgi:hypothetical protein
MAEFDLDLRKVISLWLSFLPSKFNFLPLVEKIQTKQGTAYRRTDDQVQSNLHQKFSGI